MEDDHSVMQLIDGDGIFNAVGLDNFVKEVKLAECGISYAVVSIMGPQSSGKSTLLNHLFHTKFREMNAAAGRSQTTQGIWLAECVEIKPFTIVMDLEGNDGKERGQEIAFEKQAALLALAISDILMINMRCSDIGRENAANKPLLRTVFEVMLQSMSSTRRQTTLMFIIRDLEEIWDEVPKPLARKFSRFDDNFRVEVVGLPHYIHQREKFKEEVAHLRLRFFNSTCEGGLAGGESLSVVPGLEFSYSSQQMWKVIKENKNLNLPAHKEMISTVRCEAIADEKVDQLHQNQEWLNLEGRVKIGPVRDFSKQLSSIIATYLSEYDEEVQFFDKKIRKTKRKEVLVRKALDVVYPAYESMLEHLRCTEYEKFKANVDQVNTQRKEELFHSVYTYTEAAISEFDKRSKEYLVVIPKDSNNERKPVHERVFNAVHERVSNVVHNKQSSSGVNWDASNIRMKLQNDINLHAITLFMKLFMDGNAKFEDAEKEYKVGWSEWLWRVLGVAASVIGL
ncbi:protein ROOT HAIR DEFECTIVE 3 isoform X2 [Rosa chinensis]|uniref:protein ROOT HAIR DEFECTIVE 3 isoform X2 n=1 Tax=Rosa chinensis TaxID=74649 RepID=UPI001AD8C289|nr:protein ROOT HAIR DEFECTIVE 3 isoform X2 [Rosa chinensis]